MKQSDADDRRWLQRLWATIDVTATLGSVCGAVAFIILEEAWLMGLPVILPLIALFANRQREKVSLQASHCLPLTSCKWHACSHQRPLGFNVVGFIFQANSCKRAHSFSHSKIMCPSHDLCRNEQPMQHTSAMQRTDSSPPNISFSMQWLLQQTTHHAAFAWRVRQAHVRHQLTLYDDLFVDVQSRHVHAYLMTCAWLLHACLCNPMSWSSLLM